MKKMPGTAKPTTQAAAAPEEYELPGSWWTVPADSEDDTQLVMVTGRSDVDKFRDNPRFRYHFQITWKYADQGMPDEETSRLMARVTELLAKALHKDAVAVITGIYTGAGQRDWSLYTLSLPILGRKINEILAPLPVLPLTFQADEDPAWEEYGEMSALRPDDEK